MTWEPDDTGQQKASSPDELATGAMTLDEAANKESPWRIMVWSDEGMGKTHFMYTMPTPICFIDTEGKADAIAHKFDGDIRIWQPSSYTESVEALEEAISVLDWYHEEEDKLGTIIVDSMSVLWGWAQLHYVHEYYPGKDPSDVNLSSGFGGGPSDWKVIKDYHNDKFRQVMLDTPYNIGWTAMREDDYEAIMEQGRRSADKPAGEKENKFKITDIIRIRKGPDGTPVGYLEKSGLIRHRYLGLEYPTFPKHKDLTEAIAETEMKVNTDDEEAFLSALDLPFEVEVVRGLKPDTDDS